MSTRFAVYNTQTQRKVSAFSNVSSQSVNAQTISLSSINAIPLGDNTLYTIRGNLYYKSSGGTITVLASN